MYNIKSFDTTEELSDYKAARFNTEYLILKDLSKSEGEDLYIGKGDATLPPPRPGDIVLPSTDVDDTDNAPERQDTSIDLPEGETAPDESEGEDWDA